LQHHEIVPGGFVPGREGRDERRLAANSKSFSEKHNKQADRQTNKYIHISPVVVVVVVVGGGGGGGF
jgi:hypothetical protein